MGMQATVGTPVFFFQHLRRRRQQRRIAPELVEHKALDELLLISGNSAQVP
jgi:hypothetical protein